MSDVQDGVVDDVVTDEVDSGYDYDQQVDSPATDDSDYGYDQDDQVDDSGSQYVTNTDFEALRKRNDELQRQIELMQYTGQQQSQQPQQLEYDPEDLASMRNVKEMVEQGMQGIQKAQRETMIQMQVQQAKATLPDYDKVVALGQQVIGNNAEMADLIMNKMPNPAEVVYNLGKSHPDYMKVIQQKARTDVVGKVKNNLNKPNTLSQAGGGKPSNQKSYSTMSKKDFEAELRRVKML